MGDVEQLAARRERRRPKGVADEGEALRLLDKYAVAIIGGQARVVSWSGNTLHRVRLDAFRALLDGRTHKVKVEDGEKDVPLAKWLLKRMEKYEGVVYAPGAERVVAGRLNLWRGFGVSAVEGKWPLMEAHVHDILACSDAMSATYIMQWLAWCVQNPGRQAEVALVLRGGKGAGKGVLGNAMLRIFGPHGKHISNRKHLTSGFNQHLEHCSFLFADEAYWPGDQAAEGELKRLVTEPTLTIEPKGIDPYQAANCLHVCIAGNANWVVPASDDERRYAVFSVSGERMRDTAYFKQLHDELDSGGREAMLHDLLAFELGAWHPRSSIPRTAALDEQRAESLRGVDALVATLLRDGCLPYAVSGQPSVCLTTGLEEGVGLWAYARKAIPSLHHATPSTMANALRKDWDCARWKSGNQRGVTFPPLSGMRQVYVARYGPQDWDMTEEWGS